MLGQAGANGVLKKILHHLFLPTPSRTTMTIFSALRTDLLLTVVEFGRLSGLSIRAISFHLIPRE
jgi:hypothetical protein